MPLLIASSVPERRVEFAGSGLTASHHETWDRARPSHICTGDRARPSHICTGTRCNLHSARRAQRVGVDDQLAEQVVLQAAAVLRGAWQTT